MSAETKLSREELEEIRTRTYRNGRALAVSAANESGAYTKAGTLARKHGDEGLEYRPEEVVLPEGLAVALELETSAERWGVYAYPSPVIGFSTGGPRMWTDETVAEVLRSLDLWETDVLVRLFDGRRSNSRSGASTYAHRDNTKTVENFPALAGVRFYSRIIGTPGSAGASYGEFATVRAEEAVSA